MIKIICDTCGKSADLIISSGDKRRAPFTIRGYGREEVDNCDFCSKKCLLEHLNFYLFKNEEM